MDTLESAENEWERSAALNVVPAACACYDMAACVSRDCVSNADGTGLLRCLPTPTRIPEKGRKGPLQGRALLGVVVDPSGVGVGVGLLDVQGPGTRSEREGVGGRLAALLPVLGAGSVPARAMLEKVSTSTPRCAGRRRTH
jgi:hypothetical protein